MTLHFLNDIIRQASQFNKHSQTLTLYSGGARDQTLDPWVQKNIERML